MRLRNMLKICLVLCKSKPQYAYKKHVLRFSISSDERVLKSRQLRDINLQAQKLKNLIKVNA